VSAASTVCRQSKVVEYKPLGGFWAGIAMSEQPIAESEDAAFPEKRSANRGSPKYTSTASCVEWIATRIA
jgi:hypothetical protein